MVILRATSILKGQNEDKEIYVTLLKKKKKKKIHRSKEEEKVPERERNTVHGNPNNPNESYRSRTKNTEEHVAALMYRHATK
jgi:hypothetical protein